MRDAADSSTLVYDTMEVVPAMPKGISDDRYRVLLQILIAARLDADLSQSQIAARLGQPQQFVSRYELGHRRLDIVEYVDVAAALGLDPMLALRDALSDG